ncbi:MAG: hypothetical protein ACJ74H_07950 [Thermoanaerobaculia bacterium]
MTKGEVQTTTPLISMTSILLAACYAITLATGLLSIGLTIAAWLNGTNVVEYYQYLFPHFRGAAPHVSVPRSGYAVFGVYIIVAASIAVHTRRRLAHAWLKRRRSR